MNFTTQKRIKKAPSFRALFILLLSLFFLAGLIFGGSFRSTGKSYYNSSASGHAAVFDLEAESGQKLKSVYVNVGSVYAPVGSDLTVTAKRYSSSSSPTSYTFGSAVKIGVIYSESGKVKSGALFNWIEITADSARSVASVSISTDFNADINEIVCLDENGKQIPLSVNTRLSKGYKNPAKALAGGNDAPRSFTANKSARRNFTEEEAYTLCAVKNVLGGSSFEDGNRYIVDKNFNSLGTLLYLPAVAIFGTSTGALRLTSLLASCAALLFVWILAENLFKSEKRAFAAVLLLVLGGTALSIGTFGAPYAIVASALLGSLYFMQRFFSKGVPSAHIYKGGANVLYSGLFAAVALAVDFTSIIPVLGILVLFAFGLRRMKLAYRNEAQKLADQTNDQPDQPAKAETAEADGSTAPASAVNQAAKALEATYNRKRRVTLSFAAISFLVGTFVLLLLSSVICYSAYVKAYENNPMKPTLGYAALLWKGISSSFKKGNVTSFASSNAALAFSWFLPWKPATLYANAIESGAGKADYLAKSAFTNPVLALASLVSLVSLSVKAIATLAKKDFSKPQKRFLRSFAVIGGGVLLLLLKGLVAKNASVADSFAFHVFYAMLIPLAANTLSLKTAKTPAKNETGETNEPETGAAVEKAEQKGDILLWTVAVLTAVCLLLSVPALFGFALRGTVAKALFGWMNFINNGYFRV